MARVLLCDQFELLKGSCILFVLHVDLTKAKVRRHRLLIQLDAVFEVLLGFTVLANVGQLGRQVNASTEVSLIVQQALLKVVDGRAKFLALLILAAKIEVTLQVDFLEFTRHALLYAYLELFHGILLFTLLLVYATKGDVGVGNLWVNCERLLDHLDGLVHLAVVTTEYLA